MSPKQLYLLIKSKTTNLRYDIRNSNKIGFRIIRPLYITVNYCISFAFSANYRNKTINYIKYRKHYHQVSNYTESNRYPDLFSICREYFKGKENLKILSFGCSTGEEIYSLHEYMPKATIVGTDISEYNLKECKKKPKKENISFIHSLSKEYINNKNFDAIFCLAVLQLTINRHNENHFATKYTFQQFEKQIIALDEKLNSGGLLFIDQTDFNFLETTICHKYFPLPVEGNKIENDRPLFNSNNQKVSESNDCYRVFLKN